MKNSATSILIPNFPKIGGQVLINERMSRHTTFKIGGPADIFAVPEGVWDLQALLRWAKSESVPVFILGAGSNLLVADQGVRGMVIRLGRVFARVRIEDTKVRAGAMARLSRVVRRSVEGDLSGLECLTGIPGTVGGAVCMNAGTHAGCVQDALESVVALNQDDEVRDMPVSELGLSYRCSTVPDGKLILLEATFRLKQGVESNPREVMQSLIEKRRHSQPRGIGTAGSVFKNPPGGYAGELLESVGAKGMHVGDARVSVRHANFIENAGNATAEDVRNLIDRLQHLVNDKFGVMLEPEVQFVGEW